MHKYQKHHQIDNDDKANSLVCFNQKVTNFYRQNKVFLDTSFFVEHLIMEYYGLFIYRTFQILICDD